MKLMINRSLHKASRASLMAVTGLVVLVLTGCQALSGGGIPASEYENFTPQPPEKRIMKEVTVRWEVRDDVAAYCAWRIGMDRNQANLTPPVACANWQVEKKTCMVVTGKSTSHVALGHEIRHCFEGHFH